MDLMTFLYATLLLFVSARGLAHRYLKNYQNLAGQTIGSQEMNFSDQLY